MNTKTKNDNHTIKILATSDIHGAIFPFDFKHFNPVDHSLSQVSAYIKESRKDKTTEVILLDNGDILQGSPLVYYFNYKKNNSRHICSQVMNYMNYDAATIGNHDIETGHAVYDKLNDEFTFPWMAANIIDNKTRKPYFKPYKIIRKYNFKIAVLGLITPAIPLWVPQEKWTGMQFEDMIEAADIWIKQIQENEKPDIIVGLLHSGLNYAYNHQTARTHKNENASLLVAKQIPGFDIIIAGHDHRAYNRFVKNNNGDDVLVINPKFGAKLFAEITIHLQLNQQTGKYEKTIQNQLIPTSDILPDKEFIELFSYQYNEVKQFAAQPVGKLCNKITTRTALFGNSAFVDLIHKIQFSVFNADISFAAPLSFDITVPPGDLFMHDMFKIYEFENSLYLIELKGSEIIDYIEYSAGLWFNQMVNENDNLIRLTEYHNGNTTSYRTEESFFNFDSAAGIKYTIDITKPVGQRISVISMQNGNPFDPCKTYKAIINSYRGNGGGGHLTKGAKIPGNMLEKRIINISPKDFRYYLINYFQKEKNIKAQPFNNWKIGPNRWYESARKRDYKMLYGEKWEEFQSSNED